MLTQARHTTLFALVARARRFFPREAASEVWAAARPALVGGDPSSTAALASLGWLVMFFPTKRLPECDPQEVGARQAGGRDQTAEVASWQQPGRLGVPPAAAVERAGARAGPADRPRPLRCPQVAGWVAEWMDCWDRQAFSEFWSGHWMYLLARAAKDDWKGGRARRRGRLGLARRGRVRGFQGGWAAAAAPRDASGVPRRLLRAENFRGTLPSPLPGVIDWQPHLARLYTHMLAAFRVPVGTATASPPMAVGPTGPVNTLFGHKADQVRAAAGRGGEGALYAANAVEKQVPGPSTRQPRRSPDWAPVCQNPPPPLVGPA
jgi:hypothetical protein